MAAPNQPVTLTAEQIRELSLKLAHLRHSVNNHLSLIVTATELMQRKPEMAARFVRSLSDPPARITEEIQAFSNELERLLLITRT